MTATKKEVRRPVYCKIERSEYLTEVAGAILDRESLSIKGRPLTPKIHYRRESGYDGVPRHLYATVGGVSSGMVVLGDDFAPLTDSPPEHGVPASIIVERDEDGWRVSKADGMDVEDAALCLESALVYSRFKGLARSIVADVSYGHAPNEEAVAEAGKLGRHYSSVIGWGVNRLSGNK